MDLKIFLFIVLLCMMKTSQVESQEFLKDAYKSVKSAVVKGYHHVAHIFVKHDHEDDEDGNCDYDEYEEGNKHELMEQEITTTTTTTPTITTTTTTIAPSIDIRFKEIKKESNNEPPSSLRRRDAIEDNDNVPDLDTRFFINTPCGNGMRKSAGGCRQVIHNN